MNSVWTVYLSYCWVGFLHAFFVSVCLFVFFGNKFKKLPNIIPILSILLALIFFEVYWIPLFEQLKISIYVGDKNVLNHFKIDENTNIVNTLRPNWISYLLWLFAVLFGLWIGNYVYENKIIKK